MEVMVDGAFSGEIRADLHDIFVLGLLRLILLRFTDLYPMYGELLK